MGNKFVVIDLETTGNSPKKGDRIIQFAAVIIEQNKIIEQYSSLVNPDMPIPAFIEELTGINDEMVKDAPRFYEIAPKISALLEDSYFVAHNVLFDLSFLQEELINASHEGFYGPVLDTVELARILYPTADSFKLSDLADSHKLLHERPHQADSDALVTAELLLIMMKKIKHMPSITIKQLTSLSTSLKSDLHLVFEETMNESNNSVEEWNNIDINRGIALRRPEKLIKNDDYRSKYLYPSSELEKEKLFKKAFSAYELRKGQFQMMDSVHYSLLNNRNALIEAGTGIGKSLAYLIPALFFSKSSNERVVVSTYTTQLQDQLLSKDIPLLEKMVSFPIKTSVLKGRDHYISLEKFELALKENDDNYETILTKMQMLTWLTETSTGDLDELNLSSGGLIFWNKIKSNQSNFISKEHWAEWDFYKRAQEASEEADIIITNHAFILSDLKSEKALLPSYKYVVIDEGHHFEKTAGKYFGVSINYQSLRFMLGKLGQYDQGQLFYKLEKLLASWNVQGESHLFEVNQMIGELYFEMDYLFKIITSYVTEQAINNKKGQSRIQYRFDRESDEKSFRQIGISAERLYFLLKDVIREIEKRIDIFRKHDKTISKSDRNLLEEVTSLVKELRETNEKIKALFFQNPSNGQTKWIEVDSRAAHNGTAIYSQPVSIANYLRDFFKLKKSTIITSATLTVNNSFAHLIKELGLDKNTCEVKQISSPFSYMEKVKLIVPDDLPEINSVQTSDYVVAITEHIISVAEATKGRMLILFTSHDMLRKTYELMKESGFLDDFAIIAQGITSGSRTRLTKSFQRFEKAILLGTNSFWEGVDVPGEDLSCLIIVRLPFTPPDDPVAQAKSEQIEKDGGNSFYDYSLPEAVLRFKQGFGRLIRTEGDKGIILVLDRRIVSTRYGRTFLNSIPKVPIIESSLGDIVKLIRTWL